MGWAFGVSIGLLAAVAKGFITETGFKTGPHNLRREVSFGEMSRSYLTTRPDPKGDPNL